ncbi:hypothetical protein H7J77_06045 [Mycolicibacillus parakoreensis]|uniref:DUF6542 domain-containing protein n=1 Tax=Mycolicibacillus parakoreensis TaxID=1069221 RepID=A0ABY3U719_9MYCO|nr:DUF6542 domain-containing protein [Mycolicibacillus parakoreensis]MCV7315099.1 hypothetical protein [Mycolicibacillus parakoreensis]ULN53551.1 hypothetical protein MIU77_04240 [Mycolicibacillus parakoreensis]
MSAQRARWAVSAEHRSAHPGIAGVPWWGAIVLAVALTTVGFAVDAAAGDKQLTTVFAALYALGCVVAVLAVQQSGLFTAVIQPPLLLFCSVPGAYFLFHGAHVSGLKNLLINCGYPLIERFPLMLFTSAVVLIIGAIRWLLAAVGHGAATAEAPAEAGPVAPAGPGLVESLVGRLTSLWGGGSEETTDRASRPRRHTIDRTARRGARRPPTDRAGRLRRPRSADTVDLEGQRPPRRRPRPGVGQDPERPVRSRRPRPAAGYGEAERPRRQRPRRDGDTVPPRPRRPRDPLRQPGRAGEPDRRAARYDPYETMDRQPPPRRPRVPSAPAADGTHHPISRVRYRGSGSGDAAPGRRMRDADPADSWQYDI